MLFSALSGGEAKAVNVIVVGDTGLKLVTEVVSEIRKTLRTSIAVYAPADVTEKFRLVVEREQARVVIALGREALEETRDLPVDVPVIYGLVLTPPAVTRPNTTGIYMAVPVSKYAALVKEYLPAIRTVAVIGSRDQLDILDGVNWNPHSVKNSAEFVETVRWLGNTDAILLLPNVSLLIPAAMEETYLLSFRKEIPLMGVSEGQVRDGALLALVTDLGGLGREVGEYASAVIRGVGIDELPPEPAKKFNLYLNTETARKMGIRIPGKMLEMAKGVYP